MQAHIARRVALSRVALSRAALSGVALSHVALSRVALSRGGQRLETGLLVWSLASLCCVGTWLCIRS